MDFKDSPEEAAYRSEAREWLAERAPQFEQRYERFRDVPELEGLALSKEWQALKFDHGYACIEWPEDCGGRGLSQMHAILFAEEESRYDIPAGYLGIGLGTCAPAILYHGSEEQKRRYLPKLARADEVWCQLFSEPSNGSDLAGLRTRAVRDGDEWVVNGQKVWNTGAHFADWGVLVARHDPDLAKHKGLTYFVVDMKTPGVEPRPIRQIPGTAEFNEVFFHNVRIPDANRLDEVGAGWQVAITTLMNERHGRSVIQPDFSHIFELARNTETDGRLAIEDRGVREQLAEWYVQSAGIEHNYKRMLTAISQGRRPGPEASISKVVRAKQRQDIASFGADLQEHGGVLTSVARAPASETFQRNFLHAPGMRIAAGTDEILRNIIAERVLGLPGDIRVDRDLPFREVPTGTRS